MRRLGLLTGTVPCSCLEMARLSRPRFSADRSIRSMALRMHRVEGQRVNECSGLPAPSVPNASCRSSVYWVYCTCVSYSGGQKFRVLRIVSTLRDKREYVAVISMLLAWRIFAPGPISPQ
ncbi:hypothetical protein P171DRAFT_229243 [Karstenula rhodostoma CBS 690.94]|uniref:Uncharacterized protein n=1 Tax=Karstenula rhodostoma CBS 690.94 TaxID=1392251 RepID=A0A9P4PPB1_9PLEO|nr:hypothetical protein P171DRAFT_229243 [Karstenula rhodostoma CBS 690.94]